MFCKYEEWKFRTTNKCKLQDVYDLKISFVDLAGPANANWQYAGTDDDELMLRTDKNI